jgi:N-acetylmuramoyl-L-alanine amidase
MKRLLLSGSLLALALASIVLAQTSGQAVLRTPAGDHRFTYVEQGGQTFVSAAEVITALGGEILPDSSGYRLTLSGVSAGFGSDSRFGVVRDDLIEMPVAPITIEGQPFVPWQFFHGFLSRAAEMEVSWDPAGRLMTVRPQSREAVTVQVSLANVQGISKIVLTLGAPAEYIVERRQGAYAVRFRTPIRAPFAEQSYEDPHIARLQFAGNDLRIFPTAPEIVADAYRLDDPPRIVLDFRKGEPVVPVPGTTDGPALRSRPREAPGIRTIVIDPGHGGKEVGAVGPNGLMEKDINLAVSRKLANVLSSRLGARVVLTREDDSVVSLDQRTAIANQYSADLFLSVHMNAAVVQGAKGSETYFLSLEASDELARKAAETENASSMAGGSSSDLHLILWDLAQQAYLDESSRLAQTIQESMNAATGVANRGVKQAPFKVLVGATMPAALVEVGFITNPEEESKLQSDAFQNLMVEALASAIGRYKTEYETRIGVIRPEPAAPAAAESSGVRAPASTPSGLGGPGATEPE